MDEVTKADYRLAANEATTRLQTEIGFGGRWRALVENTIYDLMKDAHERGDAQNPYLR